MDEAGEALDGGDELFEQRGLGEVEAAAEQVALGDEARVVTSGKHHYRGLAKVPAGFDLAEEFEAVDAGGS